MQPPLSPLLTKGESIFRNPGAWGYNCKMPDVLSGMTKESLTTLLLHLPNILVVHPAAHATHAGHTAWHTGTCTILLLWQVSDDRFGGEEHGRD